MKMHGSFCSCLEVKKLHAIILAVNDPFFFAPSLGMDFGL
jgi:hypothetical protein